MTASAAPSSRARSSTYGDSAPVYDRIYAWKEYAKEARVVRGLVRRFGPPNARTLLDVACGTGGHLAYLSRWFDSTGIDASPAMIALARQKVPRARFLVGRMQGFRLPERFDVITCLFSSIGYVRSEADLVRTLRNFGAHLSPGGIVIVEPWLTPQVYRAGRTGFSHLGSRESPLVRLHVAERRGDRSIMDMHHLAVIDGAVRHWVERHDMGLFDRATMRRAFRRAGLTVRSMPGLFPLGRGLYLGTPTEGNRRSPSART